MGLATWISTPFLPLTVATCDLHQSFRPPQPLWSALLPAQMDFSQLNSAEQAHMSKVIEKKQVRSNLWRGFCPLLTFFAPPQMQDFLRMYSNLVERCFNSCCNDFTSKALSSKEVSTIWCRCYVIVFQQTDPNTQETCVMNCTDKFLKHSERVGARFAEQNAGTRTVILFVTSPRFMYYPLDAMNAQQQKFWLEHAMKF
jgi:mitochondrial import inner membrane translocase subunit TIM9